MSRTRRLLSGVGLTYLNIALTTLVGLFLTRFVLREVGQHDYGLWLLVIQLTVYLTMLDFGVVALLPRDVALLAAREHKDGAVGALASHVGAMLRLVLWQLPVVALTAVVIWMVVPSQWLGVRAPLALMLAAFVVAFPLRAFQGILTGLQDLTFVGITGLLGWLASAAATVSLLLMGYGLYALATGWMIQQIVVPVAYWLRLRRTFRAALPSALPGISWKDARAQLLHALWVSLGNVAHILVNASDVIVVGALLGPAAVVPYVITGKLMGVLANVPITIANASSPALSDLLVRESHERVARALSVLTQTVVIVSGAVACGILAVNEEFIRLWVGPQQFGGMRLTIAIVAAAVLRHWILTLGMAAFAFGYERRLGIVSAVESVLTVALMFAFVKRMGPIGAPVASLLAALAVGLPTTIGAVSRATQERILALLGTVAPWGWRVAAVGTIAAVALRPWASHGLLPMAAAGAAAVLLYGFAMLPLVLRPPLRAYLVRARPGWLERLAPVA